MKKVLTIALFSVLIQPDFAYEDLIISNTNTITQIKNRTPDIINIEPIYTIMNERNTVLINVLTEGIADFSLELETGKVANFELSASKNKTEIKKSAKDFNIFVVDDYVESVELDLPPGVSEE